jgi:hypothetical protein
MVHKRLPKSPAWLRKNAPKFGAFGFTKFTMNDFSAVHLANTNVPSLRECGWYDWYYWYQQQVG